MTTTEMFIMGDPRFLSGGINGNTPRSSCDSPATMIDHNRTDIVTTDRIAQLAKQYHLVQDNYALPYLMRRCTLQCIHQGRDSYHRHEYHPGEASAAAAFNIFCRPQDLPTLGVELETYCKTSGNLSRGSQVSAMREALPSNWFHFEEDGSLDRTVGHELITEVLPPAVYRNLFTWVGLQNCLSPWLESWNHSDTGLHVHVGVRQFDECHLLPGSESDRRKLAKLAAVFVTTELLGYALGDKVFLRKPGGYCKALSSSDFTRIASVAKNGTLTAEDLFDHLFAIFADPEVSFRLAQEVALGPTRRNLNTVYIASLSDTLVGHHTELNIEHSETIEFRRGKGTLNAISIHRMVEYCSLIVRYVWKAARTPDMIISPETAFNYIINNTTSKALRKTAESVWANKKGK